MVFVSVTRLRVRSVSYLLLFLWRTFQVSRQTRVTPGFIGGRMLREKKNVFWTLTVWQDENAMRTFRSKGAHGRVMPKLMHWCDEAAYAHWTQATSQTPDWSEAHRRLIEGGKLSKVSHPSDAHAAKRIVAPRPGRGQITLKPT